MQFSKARSATDEFMQLPNNHNLRRN